LQRIVMVASVLSIGVLCVYLGAVHPAAKSVQHEDAAAQTKQVAQAATAFLNTLNVEQRQKVAFDFIPKKAAVIASFHRTSDGGVAPGAPTASAVMKGPAGPPQGNAPDGGKRMGPPNGGRPGAPGGGPGGSGSGMGPPGGFVGEQYGKAVWSNYPISDVLRPGLQLGSLSVAQRDAAMHLLQSMLSPMGYQKVLDIMGSDQALSETGQPFCSGTACYTVGIFGEPSDTKPWMVEFGGHHLGLNIVIAGTNGVMTPTLTGAQPSVYQRDGKTVRVLAQENDKAFALLDALDETQRKHAILNYEVDDLVLGPGHAGEQIQPEGLKASAMNDRQKALLLDVISEWAGIVQSAYAGPRMEEVKAGLNDTYFAWSGPMTHKPGQNGSSYYRIQGPRIVIEFSPQGVGGDSTTHVHTIYRDPTNDYGVKFNGAE
jgi:Protein of unknown function (DUF3500)